MDKHKKDPKKTVSPETNLETEEKVYDTESPEQTGKEEETSKVLSEDIAEAKAEDIAEAKAEDIAEAKAEDGSSGYETTQEETPEVEDVTERAGKTVEVDEEEMFFTRRKIKNLQDDIRKLNNELDTLKERTLRVTAEYENFRNRTAREKEEIESDVIAKALGDILPVMDNLERALIAETDDLPGLKDGVQLTLDQFVLAMKKMGVELIPTDIGFDPEYHEAVMHEMDDSRGEKEVAEVFLKGYKKGDKVVRHSVVKVVN